MSDETLFRKIIDQSRPLQAILAAVAELGVVDWYVGAGFVAQTVWNYSFRLPALYGIRDVDVAYYDRSDLSAGVEEDFEKRLLEDVPGLPLKFDVKNQARVHLWYFERFGYTIPQYQSLEAAIDTWPTTATALGVRRERNGDLEIYAPFGLEDLMGQIVRPNKIQITKEIYEHKVARWRTIWPKLVILPWNTDA